MGAGNGQLIERIQSSGHKAAMVVSGGGSGAVHDMLCHPGASRFMLEAQIPYSASAMIDYLGGEPESYCSEAAAKALAERAYERALIFTLPRGDQSPILGVACTAALQTIRERRGLDRAYICIRSRKNETLRRLDLENGTRAEQEATLSAAILESIARFLGVEE